MRISGEKDHHVEDLMRAAAEIELARLEPLGATFGVSVRSEGQLEAVLRDG